MERRNRKSKKRRILILLVALFFTTIMFTTTTYAWFTANKTVKVNTLTVNVEAQNGIQISADGTNWKSIVQTTDLTTVHNSTYATSTNQIPASLEPVSTAGLLDSSGKMEMWFGVVGAEATGQHAGEYILTATKSTEAEGSSGKFIAFDIFLKVDAATDLYLTTNSGVRTTDATDTGIKNASRIAFVYLGDVPSGTGLSTIQGLNQSSWDDPATTDVTETLDRRHVYIWEPNYDVHTAAAVTHAHDTYNATTTEGPNATQLAYAGVKAAIADTDHVYVQVSSPTAYTTSYSTKFANVSPSYSTKEGFSTKQQIFSLNAGVSKIRVYMWIEGQDVDCENSASGGTITYDLQITTEGN